MQIMSIEIPPVGGIHAPAGRARVYRGGHRRLGETIDKIPGAKGVLHGTIASVALGHNPLDLRGLWRFVMENILYHGYAGEET